jgi:DNA-binding response OmpR family regulator
LSLAELLKYELMDNGFHVSYFKIGGKAFQKLKTSPPDAIVLDILLEGRDGRLEVPEGIKRIC